VLNVGGVSGASKDIVDVVPISKGLAGAAVVETVVQVTNFGTAGVASTIIDEPSLEEAHGRPYRVGTGSFKERLIEGGPIVSLLRVAKFPDRLEPRDGVGPERFGLTRGLSKSSQKPHFSVLKSKFLR
jgi:hypothetical protein